MALASAAATSTTTTTSSTTMTATNGGTAEGQQQQQRGDGGGQQLDFSCHTLDKATKAKLTLENYYSNLVSQHRERRQRWERLEETLKDEAIPEEQRSAPTSQLF